MNLHSIRSYFSKSPKYQALDTEEPSPPTTGKSPTHKQHKYAAVLYREGTNGEVASLECLPHLIHYLEQKDPTDRILKLRTDKHGAYLSRGGQQRTVMGMPGAGQRNATHYFAQLVIQARTLDGLPQAGKEAAEQLNALTNGSAVLDTALLRGQLRTLHQAIKEHGSGSVDRSRQTITSYTAANDPRTRLSASVSSDEEVTDISLEDFGARPSGPRNNYGQPDPDGTRAQAVLTAFRQGSTPTSSDSQGPDGIQGAGPQPARHPGNDAQQVGLAPAEVSENTFGPSE